MRFLEYMRDQFAFLTHINSYSLVKLSKISSEYK